MPWRRCVLSDSEVCLKTSEIAMLMFFVIGLERRVKDIVFVVSSYSIFVFNGVLYFACRGVASTCEPPSYNDELNQYPAAVLSESLFKALKGGFHVMSPAGNIHAANRQCVYVLNRADIEGKQPSNSAVSLTNPESTELEFVHLAVFAVAKGRQCQRSKGFHCQRVSLHRN